MTRMRVKGVSKYRAKPCVIDGIRFASQKEGRRFQELKLLEKAGEIRKLELQPEFPLQVPAMHLFPTMENAIVLAGVGVYRADFAYDLHLGGGAYARIIEDVKGVRTPVYRLKKKMVEKSYGITIREI